MLPKALVTLLVSLAATQVIAAPKPDSNEAFFAKLIAPGQDRAFVEKLVAEIADDIRKCGVRFVTPPVKDNHEPFRLTYGFEDNFVHIGMWESLSPASRLRYSQRTNAIRNGFPSLQVERRRLWQWAIPHELGHALQSQSGGFGILDNYTLELGANVFAARWYRMKYPGQRNSVIADQVNWSGMSPAQAPKFGKLSKVDWFNQNYGSALEDRSGGYAWIQQDMLIGLYSKPDGDFCEYVKRFYTIGQALKD